MKKEIPENIQKILKTLPTLPGIYQMKDQHGDVIYVGKAKNLRNRVRSYFDRTGDLTVAKKQMVGKIQDIHITITQSEVEALVLETNLIKHLRPKYNILMKDDKNLSYLKITNSPIPELIKTRQKIRDGGEYFGPYASGVELSARTLRRIFRIRNCRMKFTEKNGRFAITDRAGRVPPCMDYYIGLCPAPCLLEKAKIDEHAENISQAREFLKGNSQGVFAVLEEEMREQARALDFEQAQTTKLSIDALRSLQERQKVRDLAGGNMDIILLYEKYEKSYIGMTQVRNGQVIGIFRHEISSKLHESYQEVLAGFLALQYVGSDSEIDLPDSVVLREMITDESLLLFFQEQNIKLEIPHSGPKHELLNFTQNQLREYAYKSELATLENKTFTREHMVHILEKLGYSAPKKGEIVFECYDISHTHGQFTVASRVALVNGKPDPSRYRKYNIKTLEYEGKIDDFASHREVMYRRTLEGLEQGNFPQLIIIDGGKGQLSSALSGIKEGIYDSARSAIDGKVNDQEEGKKGEDSIQVCSIAKREEEIFVPGHRDPILFEKGSPELMILQKARDESHRFAITANRSSRMKSMKKNILEEIPGIGPATRRKLLKLAGSVDEIRHLGETELKTVCNSKQIEALQIHGII